MYNKTKGDLKMAELTKDQMEMLVDFAAHQHRAEQYNKWAYEQAGSDNIDWGVFNAQIDLSYSHASKAVEIARKIGMTDDQINQCHDALVHWAEHYNKMQKAAA
jgi:hypothetical protein